MVARRGNAQIRGDMSININKRANLNMNKEMNQNERNVFLLNPERNTVNALEVTHKHTHTISILIRILIDIIETPTLVLILKQA